MNILGITGLGVSPAACLVQDGKLIAMAEEERFNRIKGSFGLLPEQATRFCLNYAGLGLDDIDYIVFPWDTAKYRLYMPYFLFMTYLKRAPKFQGRLSTLALKELLKYQPSNVKASIKSMLRKAGIKGRIPPIEFIPHHLAHAASAFYCSGFDEAHILVIDGSGEDKCTTIFKGKGLEIKEKKCFRIPDSLGWFYQSITEFLGFLPNRDEGKTMALAAYGKYNENVYSKFKKMIDFNKNGNYRYDASYSFLGKHSRGEVYSKKMVELLQDIRYPKQPIQQIHKDIAFTAQDILEKIVISLAENIAHEPDYNKKVCIAGGVGLNCKMNGVIASKNYVEDIFIPPVSNDAGSALGAALYSSKEKGYNPKFKMEQAYWGPEFTNAQIKQLLDRTGARYKEESNIETTIAELLSQDKIVGWFQGRMEIGPRALGARSILANPLKEEMKNKVNTVKGRETWRPFATSILDENKDEFLIKAKESPFMNLAFKVSHQIKENIPAVVHVDNTTRAHLVKKDVNLKYWKLIKEFGKIDGTAAILNTSLNIQGEAIACSPEDGLRTFYATSIDYLALGDFLIYK
jgi:carbamoyltransferase